MVNNVDTIHPSRDGAQVRPPVPTMTIVGHCIDANGQKTAVSTSTQRQAATARPPCAGSSPHILADKDCFTEETMFWANKSQKPAGIGAVPHWLRTLVACSLAAFLLGLVIVAQPPSGYLAESKVAITSQESNQMDWAAYLVSDEFLIKVLHTMEIRTTGDRAANTSNVSQELIEWFRGRLTVRSDICSDDGEIRFTIQFTGDSPQQAVDVVDRLVSIAQRRAQSGEKASARTHLAVRRAIEQSQQAVDRDWQRLRDLIDQQSLRFEDLTAELAVARQIKTEPTAEPNSATEPLDPFSQATTTLINPAWSRLNEHQQGLLMRRERLLARLTPAHPEMLDLEEELARTQRQIQAIPKFLEDDARSNHPPSSMSPRSPDSRTELPLVEGAAALEWPPVAPNPNSDAKLPNQCRDAVDQFTNSREAHSATIERQIEIAGSADLDSSCFVARSTSSIKHAVRPAPQPRLILLVGSVALAFGGLMLGLARMANRGPQLLISAEQVADQLGVPVVADITLNHPLGIRHFHPKTKNALRRIVFACEVVVLVLLAAFVMSGFVGSDLAARCLSEPFAGFGESIRQLFSLNGLSR
jgi:hypothetical protein